MSLSPVDVVCEVYVTPCRQTDFPSSSVSIKHDRILSTPFFLLLLLLRNKLTLDPSGISQLFSDHVSFQSIILFVSMIGMIYVAVNTQFISGVVMALIKIPPYTI